MISSARVCATMLAEWNCFERLKVLGIQVFVEVSEYQSGPAKQLMEPLERPPKCSAEEVWTAGGSRASIPKR